VRSRVAASAATAHDHDAPVAAAAAVGHWASSTHWSQTCRPGAPASSSRGRPCGARTARTPPRGPARTRHCTSTNHHDQQHHGRQHEQREESRRVLPSSVPVPLVCQCLHSLGVVQDALVVDARVSGAGAPRGLQADEEGGSRRTDEELVRAIDRISARAPSMHACSGTAACCVRTCTRSPPPAAPPSLAAAGRCSYCRG